MSSRALFKDKQLRLCVVTTLVVLPAGNIAEALLLPPRPLTFSSTWDCSSGSDNDWLCNASIDRGYSQSSEPVVGTSSRKRQIEQSYSYHSEAARAPVYSDGNEPIFAEEVYTQASVVTDSAVLVELLNASPENYVLQWMAANDREPLERLKSQHPVLQDATIAEYQRSGKNWFILLDGPFPSRIAAMAALKRDARAVIAGKFYPWTRSVASIQQLDFIRPEQIAGSSNYPARAQKHPYTASKQTTFQSTERGRIGSQQRKGILSRSAKLPSYDNDGGYNSHLVDEFRARDLQQPYVSTQEIPFARQSVQSYQPQSYVSTQEIPFARQSFESYQPQSYVSAQEVPFSRQSVESRQQEEYARTQEIPFSRQSVESYKPQYLVNAPRNIQPERRPLSQSASDRYGYPKNYDMSQERSRQESNHLERPFQNTYTESNYNEYQLPSNASERLYSQRQPEANAYFNSYEQQPSYNNDLKYAVASTGQQIILPPPKKRAEEVGYTRPNSESQAYRQSLSQQQPDYNVDQYEYSDYAYNPDFYREPARPQRMPPRQNESIRPEPLRYGHNRRPTESVHYSPPASYTIQWLAANNKSSLERVQLRFPVLQNTRIIHYRRRNLDWYVLVGGIFVSREAAQEALTLPPYSRLTARLYPWVRSVDALKKMVAGGTVHKKASTNSDTNATALEKIISNTGSNNYTIQWYAANKPGAVKKMKQRFPELANAVTVHFKRNNKDWYVLLQGQYDSSHDAISAIKSPAMRNAKRVLHPWTRPVSSLKRLALQEKI